LTRWIRDQRAEVADDAWEVDHADPETEPDRTRTDVIRPFLAV
jgi:effector-binding domain-containing protein